MHRELRVPVGPVGRQVKEVVTFRAPPELLEWLKTHVDEDTGVRLTDAVLWALGVARDYTQAVEEHEVRLKRLAQENDLTDLGVLKRVIERGLPALEKELKGGKR